MSRRVGTGGSRSSMKASVSPTATCTPAPTGSATCCGGSVSRLSSAWACCCPTARRSSRASGARSRSATGPARQSTARTPGTPKAPVHLHHDMLVCCEAFGRHVLEIGPEDRTFSVAKLFFAYGLGNALYFPFHMGASTVLYPGRPEPAKVFE